MYAVKTSSHVDEMEIDVTSKQKERRKEREKEKNKTKQATPCSLHSTISSKFSHLLGRPVFSDPVHQTSQTGRWPAEHPRENEIIYGSAAEMHYPGCVPRSLV